MWTGLLGHSELNTHSDGDKWECKGILVKRHLFCQVAFGSFPWPGSPSCDSLCSTCQLCLYESHCPLSRAPSEQFSSLILLSPVRNTGTLRLVFTNEDTGAQTPAVSHKLIPQRLGLWWYTGKGKPYSKVFHRALSLDRWTLHLKMTVYLNSMEGY